MSIRETRRSQSSRHEGIKPRHFLDLSYLRAHKHGFTSPQKLVHKVQRADSSADATRVSSNSEGGSSTRNSKGSRMVNLCEFIAENTREVRSITHRNEPCFRGYNATKSQTEDTRRRYEDTCDPIGHLLDSIVFYDTSYTLEIVTHFVHTIKYYTIRFARSSDESFHAQTCQFDSSHRLETNDGAGLSVSFPRQKKSPFFLNHSSHKVNLSIYKIAQKSDNTTVLYFRSIAW